MSKFPDVHIWLDLGIYLGQIELGADDIKPIKFALLQEFFLETSIVALAARLTPI